MAGRSREPGAEVRSERMSVRWTKSEMDLLERYRERERIAYLGDVPRIMTLQQLHLEELIGDKSELLERARKGLGLETREEVIWALASRRLEEISSLLENHVAE